MIASLSGCSAFSYYSQATRGHLAIIAKRQAIAKVLEDPNVSPQVKTKLELVRQIRAFASNKLALPDNDSYLSYVDIKQRYVVWNVFATPDLSLQPVESCFLVVGCLSYRGYYSEADAQNFAAELRATGYDVYVGGVAAYSTLGWFDDPVLNTMLYWDDRRLARLIFHELTHQLLYVKNDALFNESFATNFAEIGLEQWLEANGPEKANEPDAADEREREIDFLSMIKQTRQQLASIYDATHDEPSKRKLKTATFRQLQQDYLAFKARWDGYSGYDEWMTKDMNNAKVSSVVTYHSYDKAFRHLLNQAGGKLNLFVDKVRDIAALDETARHRCLHMLNTDEHYQCEILGTSN